MRVDLARLLPSVLLAGYGGFIISLYLRGDLTLYISPSYVWPSTLAAIVLVLLSVVRLLRTASATNSHCCSDETCACEAGIAEDDCGCAAPTKRIWPYAILAIPLFLAVLFPPRSLAAFSARQRGLQIAGLTPVRGAAPISRVSLSVDTRTFTLQDWVGALSADPNPKDYTGKPVVLTGMVIHAPASVPPGYIMVLRYQVTCCIADARPEGLIVKDSSHGVLKDNQWVTVTGKMGAAAYHGQQLAVVVPKSIAATKAGNPYMY